MADKKWSATDDAVAILTDKLMFLDATDTTNKLEAISTILDLQNAETKTLTNKTIDWTDNTITFSSAEAATACSDETGSGDLTFATSPTFVTPALGVPASGTMTNVTGIPNAAILDDVIALTKLVIGTKGEIIGTDGTTRQLLAVGTNDQVLTAASGETTGLKWAAAPGGAITFTDAVLCTLEVPEGTVAFPDIHTLATAGAKVSGMVLPDGASTSEINFKCRVPRDVASTPAMKIRIRIMTLAADTAHAVRLTVGTVGHAVNEDADVALTAETEITAEMPDGTETMNEAVIEVDLTTDWAADDTVFGQLQRDPTDAVDDYAGDILVLGIELLVDRTIS